MTTNLSSWTKSNINAAKKAVEEHRSTVNLTTFWGALNKDIGIGKASGKKLILSVEDRMYLKQLLDKSNLLAPNLLTSETRSDLAKITANEKLNRSAVFANRVRVGVLGGGPIKIRGQVIALPSGVYVEAIISEIDITDRSIVFVENGECMFMWDDPTSDLVGSLLVYRGHGKEMNEVHQLLTDARERDLKVVAYYDYDPSGLMMLHSGLKYFTHYLVPADGAIKYILKHLPHLNKTDKAHVQINEHLKASRSLLPEFKMHWDLMASEKIALTQEGLNVNHVEMRVVEIRRNSKCVL